MQQDDFCIYGATVLGIETSNMSMTIVLETHILHLRYIFADEV